MRLATVLLVILFAVSTAAAAQLILTTQQPPEKVIAIQHEDGRLEILGTYKEIQRMGTRGDPKLRAIQRLMLDLLQMKQQHAAQWPSLGCGCATPADLNGGKLPLTQ